MALPKTWCAVDLGDLCVATEQVEPAADREFFYIDISAIDRETKRIAAPQSLLGRDAPSRARKLVRAGDTLVSMTRPNLNAVALVGPEFDGQVASTGFDVLRAPGVEPRWISYLVRTAAFVDAMCALVQGALYPAVRSKDVRAYTVPVAPLAEQQRIADKLDTVLVRVNACRDRLARVAPLLRRFRQSVLAAATSGRLTNDWRSAAAGRSLTNWKSTSVGALSNVVRGASPRPAGDPRYFGGGCPWITVGELTKDERKFLDETRLFVTEAGKERSRYIAAGTLLLTNSGATLGVPKITTIGGCINDGSVALLGLAEPLKSYLYWLLRGQTESLRALNQGAAQPNLNTSIVKAIEVPLPPTDEQAEIVRRVETLFAFADLLEARLAQGQAAVDRLTPSLLAKAFRGELVPQDPADEPASELLGRLSASALAVGAALKPQRRNGGRKSA